MARKPRRRRKFAPLRMSKRFQKTMIVALGILLMVVFALPRDACQRRQGQQEDLDRVVATRAGRQFTYGDAKELAERWQRVFRHARPMPAEAAAQVLLSCYEAERAEVRVSQAEVEHAIQNQVFPRQFRIEYVFAKHDEKGAEDAHSRVADARKRILKIGGKARQQALQSVAKELGLSIDTTGPLTAQAARTGRLGSDEARDILDTIMKDNLPFTVPIGAVSEVSALKELTFIFRVVSRTPGFAPDKLFYEEQEGWVTQGYGTKKQVKYTELLSERKTTQGEIERAVREQRLAGVVQDFFVGSAGPGPASLPQATLRDRYRRNNTTAEAACLTLRRSDFEAGIRPTEAELRAFYDQRDQTLRTGTTVGYYQPERVAIQYIVGRRTTQKGQWGAPDRKGIDDLIPDEDVRQYYVDNRQGKFKGKPYDGVQGEIRTDLAELHLPRIISNLRTQIAKQSDPGLSELVEKVPARFRDAFECQTTNEFSAAEARDKPPELRAASRRPGEPSESLEDVLFGQAGQQFLLPKAEPDPNKSQTYISKNFRSAAGMYFFRVIKRTAEHEIEFDDVPEVAPKKDPDKPQPSWPKREPQTREGIRQDFVRHKAMELAEQKAKEYRTNALDEAFGQLAKALGAEPKDASIPVPTTPEEPSDPVSRAFYRQLAEREAGDLSTPVESDGKFQIARLVEKKEAQGIQLKVISFTEDDLPASFDYRASDLELRRRYRKNKFRYLDPPVPIPFEKVKDDIHKLLLKRKTREEAARRIRAALADLGGDKPPKLSEIAKTHKLQLHPGVKVDLAHTEATPQIGKAAGFHDAVADKALEPGKASKELAGLSGRFCFLLRARDAKAATIDVLAAPYDAIKPETKLAKDEAKKHYDAQTDTDKHYQADAPAHVGAYLKHEEIKQDAPDWDDVSESVRARLQKLFGGEWAKRPFARRVRQLRNSLVLEAIRAAPEKAPLQVKRAVELKALTTQLPLRGPAKGIFRDNLHARKLVRALGDGELSQPIETQKGALLAFVEKRTDKLLSVLYLTVPNADLKPESDDDEPPTDEQLQKHLESRKERFRRPAEIKAEFLAVDFQALRSKRKLAATDKELRKEHARGVKEKDEAYADPTKPGYVPLEFAKAKEIARGIVLRNKARAEAEKLLATLAKQIAPQGAKADLKALAAKHELVDHSTSGWFDAEREAFEPVGLAPDLAQKAFAAKKGQTIGPLLGVKGACLCRRTELKAATVPPLNEIRDAVAKDYETHRDNEHAMAAAARLRKTLAEALAKAKDKPKGLRDAVKGATPLIVQIPKTIRVTLSPRVHPLAGNSQQLRFRQQYQQYGIPLPIHLEASFLEGIFRLLPAQITPVVKNSRGDICCVAALARYIDPDPDQPDPQSLERTADFLQAGPSYWSSSDAFRRSWRTYLFGETPPAP